MKNKILALILAVFVLLTALQSCNNAVDYESETEDIQEDELFEVFEMQEKTDKLVVYRTPVNSHYLNPALNIFKEKYPEVEVEIITIPYTTTVDEFQLRLNTELAVGKAPDLLLIDTRDVPDIYKMMASETFVNLNHFIESDSEFEMDEYNHTVLDAGVFRGRRYIMPLAYLVPVLMTTQEILDAEGITHEDLSTFDGFVGVAEKFNEKYKDNPDKSVFRNWQDSSRNIRTVEKFFPWSGVDLIDYTANKVVIDKAKFKNVMDMIKPIYLSKGEEVMAMQGDAIIFAALRNHEWLFGIDRTTITSIEFYTTYDRFDANDMTPLYLPYPNIENGVTAEVLRFAAIPKAAKNQINAYNLLKIILSDEIQSTRMYLHGIPVLKDAVKSKADNELKDYSELTWSSGTLEELRSRFEEIINEYTDMLINVKSVKMLSNAPYREFLMEEMIPYFEGKRSFDDCYDRLVSKLEIYISE